VYLDPSDNHRIEAEATHGSAAMSETRLCSVAYFGASAFEQNDLTIVVNVMDNGVEPVDVLSMQATDCFCDCVHINSAMNIEKLMKER
jgi:hypothetical protein